MSYCKPQLNTVSIAAAGRINAQFDRPVHTVNQADSLYCNLAQRSIDEDQAVSAVVLRLLRNPHVRHVIVKLDSVDIVGDISVDVATLIITEALGFVPLPAMVCEKQPKVTAPQAIAA